MPLAKYSGCLFWPGMGGDFGFGFDHAGHQSQGFTDIERGSYTSRAPIHPYFFATGTHDVRLAWIHCSLSRPWTWPVCLNPLSARIVHLHISTPLVFILIIFSLSLLTGKKVFSASWRLSRELAPVMQSWSSQFLVFYAQKQHSGWHASVNKNSSQEAEIQKPKSKVSKFRDFSGSWKYEPGLWWIGPAFLF